MKLVIIKPRRYRPFANMAMAAGASRLVIPAMPGGYRYFTLAHHRRYAMSISMTPTMPRMRGDEVLISSPAIFIRQDDSWHRGDCVISMSSRSEVSSLGIIEGVALARYCPPHQVSADDAICPK